MGKIIDLSDFKQGRYKVNQSDFTESDLTWYINEMETKYLVSLLGVELYNLFIADLFQGNPQDQRFIDIYNAFNYDKYGEVVTSQGLIEMLKGFIFCEFTREQNFDNSINGNTQKRYEIGDTVTARKNGLMMKYNASIKNYCAIQRYICDNKDSYPEFNGQPKGYTGIL